MIPSRKTKNVFKSRWNALFWSVGVLVTAYCTVPSPGEEDKAAVAIAAAASSNAPQVTAPVSPPVPNRWAKQPRYETVSTPSNGGNSFDEARTAADTARDYSE